MKIRKEFTGHQVTIYLEGELVGIYALRLQEQLTEFLTQGINYFIFDLSNVRSIDSIGLISITSLKNSNVWLTYRNMKPQVQEMVIRDHGGKYKELISITG